MFQRIVETSADVQSFAIQESIYLLCDRRIQVFDGRSYEKIAETRLFEKEGSARSFIMDGDHIYCKDFVHLYVLERESLSVVARLQLGTDLSSDICGMALDEGYVYLGIRNGAVARVEKAAWEHVEYYPLSASSIWTMECNQGRIYAGNVDGQLLAIDAASMEVEKRVQAHRQNLKSLCILDHVVATASQDKALASWDKRTLEPIAVKKNAHKKAFAIVGAWNGHILTVSFACGEIKVWDMRTLKEKTVLPIAPCLFGQTFLHRSHLYLSSRAIHGIDYADIDGCCDLYP